MDETVAVYICDGSSKKKDIGAGIVRKKDGKTYTYHFHTKARDRWLDIHEHFAIEETLNLIQKFGDKKASIYNDDFRLIERINHHNPRLIPTNPILTTTEYVLLSRIQQMKESGYELSFLVCNKEIESEAHDMAHYLSRSYMREKERKKK